MRSTKHHSQHGGFEVYERARELVRAVVPLLRIIERVDKDLARQISRALNSVVLNIREGNHSTRGNRRQRFEDAMGSASEVEGGLHHAVDKVILSSDQTACAEELSDRVRAMLFRLIHPRR